MFGPYIYQKPRKLVVGARYRKRGESLDWELIEAEDDRIVLKGPGYATGHMYLDRVVFEREYERT